MYLFFIFSIVSSIQFDHLFSNRTIVSSPPACGSDVTVPSRGSGKRKKDFGTQKCGEHKLKATYIKTGKRDKNYFLCKVWKVTNTDNEPECSGFMVKNKYNDKGMVVFAPRDCIFEGDWTEGVLMCKSWMYEEEMLRTEWKDVSVQETDSMTRRTGRGMTRRTGRGRNVENNGVNSAVAVFYRNDSTVNEGYAPLWTDSSRSEIEHQLFDFVGFRKYDWDYFYSSEVRICDLSGVSVYRTYNEPLGVAHGGSPLVKLVDQVWRVAGFDLQETHVENSDKCTYYYQGFSRLLRNKIRNVFYSSHSVYLFEEPHYRTFDGKDYAFQGDCSYYLLRSEHNGLEVIGKNWKHGLERLNATFVKEISVTYRQTTIKLMQNKEFSVSIDGDEMTDGGESFLRNPFATVDIFYHSASMEFDQVDLIGTDGSYVRWDGKGFFEVHLSSQFSGDTFGLLGNFNGNSNDDLMLPNGDVTTDIEVFGDAWKVPESCPDDADVTDLEIPEIEDQMWAESICSTVNSHPFSSCNDYDAERHRVETYDDCVHDITLLKKHPQLVNDSFCTFLDEFVEDNCVSLGETINNWREQVPQCNSGCPDGMTYVECGNPCTFSCTAIIANQNVARCVSRCVQGCRCSEDFTYHNNQCIGIDSCYSSNRVE